MVISKSIKNVRQIVRVRKKKNEVIGFVPTMGALHQGHISLITRARKETNFLVVSIFINPLQFGPKEDYKKYPRNFKEDGAILRKEGVDLIFYPSPGIMYPSGFSTRVEENFLSKVLCGKSRPTHFKGVTTVVAKLFNIVEPDIAYFGQKDYQQAQIIKSMIKDLNFHIKVKILPIIREKSGLALSSRNMYLNSEEKKDGLVLFKSLKLAKELVRQGQRNTHFIREALTHLINSKKTTKIDYVELVDPRTLRPIKKIDRKVLVALAVFVGKTRLIDNTIIRVESSK